MSNPSTFGKWLKQRRKALGLTQKELAQQAGCAEVTVRKVESGDLHPSALLAVSLAKAAGAAEADLPGLVAQARGVADDFTARARLLRSQLPNNLPAQLTPLIGRQHDITAVRKRLLSDGARLVTLVGPPGVGKTRLALAVAEDVLEQFADGAFFVRLAPVSDPDQVAATIAQALGLEMSGPNPPELQLRAYLEEKHLFLALDNFEQILPAAPLVDDLLRRCPWLYVLVTSRQPLRVRGERQVIVRPLLLPAAAPREIPVTAEDMLRYPAVALFADRAEAVVPDFAVDNHNAAAVAELCRRLDGLPLAIELVAARIKLLPPAELLSRLHGPWLLSADGLRDVSARQKTLRGAIGWSYDLLTPGEQVLFKRLAVFAGGCTLEAAGMMCEDVLAPAQVLDGIASLLDKNLLQREAGLYGGTRYPMLETVREYGLERLAKSGQEDTAQERHARCFLRILDNADQAEINPRKPQLNRLIDDEIHNLRAALDWFKRHDVQATLILTTHLLRWYGQRGPREEGRRLSDEVLGLPGASAGTIHRARMLFEAGILMIQNDEFAKALEYEEESLLLSEETGDSKGKADALLGLGRVAWAMCDWNTAFHCLENALAVYRAVRDPGGTSYSLVLLAHVTLHSGLDISRARTLAEESLAVARQADFQFPWAMYLLSAILVKECDLDAARLLLEETLTVVRHQEGKPLAAACLLDLGDIATRQDDFTAAQTFLDESQTLYAGLGDKNNVLHGYQSLAYLSTAMGKYRQAVQLYRLSMPAVSLRGMCDFLMGLASLAQAVNQYELAVRLLGAIDLVARTRPLDPIERQDCSRVARAIGAHLDAEQWDAALATGRTQPFAQIAEEAVSNLEEVLNVKMQAVSA